jgi:hypothetical protein
MKPKPKALFCIIGLFFATACNGADRGIKGDSSVSVGVEMANEVEPEMSSGSDFFVLADADLRDQTALAESGDLTAIKTLGDHYNALGDIRQELRWTFRAAQLGDIRSAQMVLEYGVEEKYALTEFSCADRNKIYSIVENDANERGSTATQYLEGRFRYPVSDLTDMEAKTQIKTKIQETIKAFRDCS